MSLTLHLQDLIAIWGPMGTLIGFMWYHFNHKFEKIDDRFVKMASKMEDRFEKVDIKIDNLSEKLNNVEEKLGEKIDVVRDRVSRIEGQLVPAKMVSFEEIRPQTSAHNA
jgi:hypothetical protein